MQLDFSSGLHYFWALLPEFILSVAGMVVLVAGVSGKHAPDAPKDEGGDPSFSGGADLGWIALVGLLFAGFANGWLYGIEEVGDTAMVAVDGFRLFANWIFLVAAALTILISFAYVYRQRLQAGEFYGLILLSTAGMMFMAGARDLMIVFLGLEVMSISVYAMTAFNRRDKKSAEAGLKSSCWAPSLRASSCTASHSYTERRAVRTSRPSALPWPRVWNDRPCSPWASRSW